MSICAQTLAPALCFAPVNIAIALEPAASEMSSSMKAVKKGKGALLKKPARGRTLEDSGTPDNMKRLRAMLFQKTGQPAPFGMINPLDEPADPEAPIPVLGAEQASEQSQDDTETIKSEKSEWTELVAAADGEESAPEGGASPALGSGDPPRGSGDPPNAVAAAPSPDELLAQKLEREENKKKVKKEPTPEQLNKKDMVTRMNRIISGKLKGNKDDKQQAQKAMTYYNALTDDEEKNKFVTGFKANPKGWGRLKQYEESKEGQKTDEMEGFEGYCTRTASLHMHAITHSPKDEDGYILMHYLSR